MPLTIRPSRLHYALLGIFSLFLSLISLSGLVQAEPRAILAEATYIMGDGETPDFAEARALQKAKQNALEEAGTYVQSYTKVQNLDLTTEEIQTIAGGVLHVEVLEKTRTLVTDGLRVYSKIRATVTTDKMQELALRIKDKNIAEEYTQFQAEYAKLSQELEVLKQNAAKTPKGLERNAALNQIREGEKAFARVQQRESDLFQRLVSGKQLVGQASHDKEIIDELLQTIATSGYFVTVGDVQSVSDSEKPDMLVLKVPLTIQVSETVQGALSHAAKALGGTVEPDVAVTMNIHQLRIGAETGANAKVSLVRIGKHAETVKYFQDETEKLAFLVTFHTRASESAYCFLGPKGGVTFLHPSQPDYLPLQRIFRVVAGYRRERSQLRQRFFGFGDDYLVTVPMSGPYDTFESVKSSDPLWEPDRKSGPPGFVAIVRDEATFVATHNLPAEFVRNLTGVSVNVISVPNQKIDKRSVETYLREKRFLELYGGGYQCGIVQ